IFTSEITTSKVQLADSSDDNPSAPSLASSTCHPRRVKKRRSAVRIDRSSSMIKMLGVVVLLRGAAPWAPRTSALWSGGTDEGGTTDDDCRRRALLDLSCARRKQTGWNPLGSSRLSSYD